MTRLNNSFLARILFVALHDNTDTSASVAGALSANRSEGGCQCPVLAALEWASAVELGTELFVTERSNL